MNVAVKFWIDMPINDRLLPGNWPAEVIENENGPLEGYTIMTKEELDLYKETNIELFNIWKATYLP